MLDEPLANLLHQTDSANPLPASDSADWAAGGRRRAAQRQQRRNQRRFAATFAFALAAWLALTPWHQAIQRMANPAADTSALTAAITAQQAKVDLLLKINERTNTLIHLARLREAGSVETRLACDREFAAATLLENVALASDQDRRDDVYRTVIHLFPDSGAAIVAGKHLSVQP